MEDWNTYLRTQQKNCLLTNSYQDGYAYLRMMDNGHKWIFSGNSCGTTKENASSSVVSFLSDSEIYGKKVFYTTVDGVVKQTNLICGFTVENGFYVYTFDFGEQVCIDSVEIS